MWAKEDYYTSLDFDAGKIMCCYILYLLAKVVAVLDPIPQCLFFATCTYKPVEMARARRFACVLSYCTTPI